MLLAMLAIAATPHLASACSPVSVWEVEKSDLRAADVAVKGKVIKSRASNASKSEPADTTVRTIAVEKWLKGSGGNTVEIFEQLPPAKVTVPLRITGCESNPPTLELPSGTSVRIYAVKKEGHLMLRGVYSQSEQP